MIPAAIAGWYISLFFGMILYFVADYICPPDLMVSGMCLATWHSPVTDGLVIFGASLAAVLAILFSVLIAPGRKALVAKVIFLGGAGMAIYFVIATSEWLAFLGAIVFGFITVILIQRNSTKLETIPSL